MKNVFPREYRGCFIPIILGYEVVDDEIIIKYNTKFKAVFPYSKKRELEILQSMKNQISYCEDILDTNKERYKTDKLFMISNFTFLLSNILNAIRSKVPTIHYTLVGVFMLLFSYYTNDVIKGKKFANEIEKHKLFIEYEDVINEDIIAQYNEMIANFPVNNPGQIPTISINDLDNFTLQEMKEIISSITSSEEYNLKQKK